jgi:hypothetical protein
LCSGMLMPAIRAINSTPLKFNVDDLKSPIGYLSDDKIAT